MGFRLDILKESATWAQSLDDANRQLTARLDDKAQQTGGMAGLFLAAGFGFIKPESMSWALTGSNRWLAFLLIAIIVILLLCLGACLSVTWLRSAPMPLALAALSGLNEDVLQLPNDLLTDSVQENYYRDRIALWQQTIDIRVQLNRGKARRLLTAQALLAASMFFVSLLLFAVIRSILLSPKAH